MVGCRANRFAVIKVALMSNDELLVEEVKLKNDIQLLKSWQLKMPHAIFVCELNLLDKRLQAVIEEIERRIPIN